jgi:hypothetical protein
MPCPKEDTMTKTRLALVTAILALSALLTSAAEAGMKVRLQFGYPLGSFTAHGNSGGSGGYRKYRKPQHDYVRRNVKSKVQVSKNPTPAKSVAKAEPEAAKIEAETENSSISTAATAPVKETGSTAAPAGDEPKVAKKTDCKQFFPSVGMTLTVPCE